MPISSAAGFVKSSSLSMASFNPIFKEVYLPAVRDLLNSKRILSRIVNRNSEDVEGKYAVISLNTGRNEGGGYIAEGGKLPDPQKQEYDQARYWMRYGYHRIKFTGPSASSSRSDRGSFLRIMDAEIRGAARDAEHEANRIMFGDGSGRLCQLDGTAGAPTYSVKNPGGFTSSGLGTQYLRPNMRIAVVDAEAAVMGSATLLTDGSSNKAFTISSVDHANGTVTLNASISGAGGDEYFYTASEVSANVTDSDIGRGNEPFGLEGIIDDGNPFLHDGAHGFAAGVGEVNATNVPAWRSFVIANGGTPIPFSQDMFQQAMDGVDINGDGVVQLWMTTHGIRRQYVNQLLANKRYVGTMEYDGGFKAVSFDDRPVVVDKDCPRGRVYGLDTECLHLFSETDWDWIDQDGSVLHRMQDEDAFQATLYRYWQFGTDARNRLCKIEDILDT